MAEEILVCDRKCSSFITVYKTQLDSLPKGSQKPVATKNDNHITTVYQSTIYKHKQQLDDGRKRTIKHKRKIPLLPNEQDSVLIV